MSSVFRLYSCLEAIKLVGYIKKLVAKLQQSEKGQGMVEYALIIAFVAAIAIFAFNNGLGDAVRGAFDSACSMVDSASGEAQNAAQQGTGGTVK